MKKLALGLTSAIAALCIAGTAIAQAPPALKPGVVGLITDKDGVLVVLSARAGTPLLNRKAAGEGCKLQPNDKVEIVSIQADGTVLVKRLRYIGLRKPDIKVTCPTGALVSLKKELAEAAVMAKQAADAKAAADKTARGKRS